MSTTEPQHSSPAPLAALSAPSKRPLLTLALIGGSTVTSLLWWSDEERVQTMLCASDLDLWQGTRLWALFTSMFPHLDGMHLFFNSCWCWHFGRVMEGLMPRLQILLIVLVTTIFSSASELTASSDCGVGMSGMVYGLFGFLLATQHQQPAFREAVHARTSWLLLACLPLGFLLNETDAIRIANWAHVGGFVSGLLLGLASFVNRWRFPARLSLGVASAAAVMSLVWAPWQDNWHLARALSAVDSGDYATGLPRLDTYLQRCPDDAWAAEKAATLRIDQKDYRRAREILETSADMVSDAVIENSLAWLLATCPDDSIRDGQLAIRWAKEACEDTDWEEPSYLDTLAAAYAECGNFTEAVKWSTKAVAICPEPDRQELEANLRTLKSGKPIRQP